MLTITLSGQVFSPIPSDLLYSIALSLWHIDVVKKNLLQLLAILRTIQWL